MEDQMRAITSLLQIIVQHQETMIQGMNTLNTKVDELREEMNSPLPGFIMAEPEPSSDE